MTDMPGTGWHSTMDALKKNAYFKDSVLITIGKIDDTNRLF
jgi:hypothetical protein